MAALRVATALSVLLAAVGTSQAFAGSETYMGVQGLSAGNAFASGTVHVHINTSGADVDHTACVGYGSGWGGYTSTPLSGGNSMLWGVCGYTSGGTVPWWSGFDSGSANKHGAVYNPNGATFDNFTWALYEWV